MYVRQLTHVLRIELLSKALRVIPVAPFNRTIELAVITKLLMTGEPAYVTRRVALVPSDRFGRVTVPPVPDSNSVPNPLGTSIRRGGRQGGREDHITQHV